MADPLRILLVSGWRELEDEQPIVELLDRVLPHLVVHGGCRGFDQLVDRVARRRHIARAVFDYVPGIGKQGGPVRNQQMVDHVCRYATAGHNITVVCMPGPTSRGTYDLRDRAVAAGLNPKVQPVNNKENRHE